VASSSPPLGAVRGRLATLRRRRRRRRCCCCCCGHCWLGGARATGRAVSGWRTLVDQGRGTSRRRGRRSCLTGDASGAAAAPRVPRGHQCVDAQVYQEGQPGTRNQAKGEGFASRPEGILVDHAPGGRYGLTALHTTKRAWQREIERGGRPKKAAKNVSTERRIGRGYHPRGGDASRGTALRACSQASAYLETLSLSHQPDVMRLLRTA